MAAKKCAECGAELELGSAPCPLCGTEATSKTSERKPKPVADVATYQSDLRKLREELKQLREAEAS